jgi:hypothetical protein
MVRFLNGPLPRRVLVETNRRGRQLLRGYTWACVYIQ